MNTTALVLVSRSYGVELPVEVMKKIIDESIVRVPFAQDIYASSVDMMVSPDPNRSHTYHISGKSYHEFGRVESISRVERSYHHHFPQIAIDITRLDTIDEQVRYLQLLGVTECVCERYLIKTESYGMPVCKLGPQHVLDLLHHAQLIFNLLELNIEKTRCKMTFI